MSEVCLAQEVIRVLFEVVKFLRNLKPKGHLPASLVNRIAGTSEKKNKEPSIIFWSALFALNVNTACSLPNEP